MAPKPHKNNQYRVKHEDNLRIASWLFSYWARASNARMTNNREVFFSNRREEKNIARATTLPFCCIIFWLCSRTCSSSKLIYWIDGMGHVVRVVHLFNSRTLCPVSTNQTGCLSIVEEHDYIASWCTLCWEYMIMQFASTNNWLTLNQFRSFVAVGHWNRVNIIDKHTLMIICIIVYRNICWLGLKFVTHTVSGRQLYMLSNSNICVRKWTKYVLGMLFGSKIMLS